MKEEFFCKLSIIVPEILVHDTCLYKKQSPYMMTLKHRKLSLLAKDDSETLYIEMECLGNF